MMIHTEPGIAVTLRRDYQKGKWEVAHETADKVQKWTFETCNAAIKRYNDILRELDRND